MAEIWKPVVGYEGFYEISDLGNLVRVSTCGGKPCRKPRVPAIKGGYRSFHLCAHGIRRYRLAHIMVWEAFKGPIPSGLEVNHEDGNKERPILANLDLLTKSENHKHAYRVLKRTINVRPQPGEKNGSSKLTVEQVLQIRELHAAHWRRIDIARKFGVSDTNIGLITSRKKWRHI